MDNVSIIAVASIVTAGFSTSIGCMFPAYGRREISIKCFKFNSTAARCCTNHHKNFIRWIGND